MFVSNGYFKGAFCPFYQYGLCHRPYCHFKHAKAHTTANESTIAIATRPEPPQTPSSSKKKFRDSDIDDEVMKIVKNVPKCREYSRKKEEEKELKKVLELIDKENREKEKTARFYSTSSSDGEHGAGLVDAFYKNNESLEIGTFTSHGDLNEHSSSKESLTDLTAQLIRAKKRRICECDDSDCSGFIEEDDNEVEEEIGADNTKNDRAFQSKDDDSTPSEIKEKCRKLSDVDFFSCQTESNVKKKKKKKKKNKVESTNDDRDEVLEEINCRTKRKKHKNDDATKEGVRDGVPADKPSKKKKIKKDGDDNYEMVFLEEGEDKELKTKIKIEKDKTTATDKVNDYISIDSVPTTGQGSGKKRIAHSTDEVKRLRIQQPSKLNSKKLSYISPGLAAPITHQPTNDTPTVVPDVSASMGFTTETGVYVGKKRVAHSNPNVATVQPTVIEKVKRPKLPMEFGGKIPHLIRQRYLDKIIDELTPKCESEKVAIEKGFSEEAVANQRSSMKQIYMNLCANVIKRVRGMPTYVVAVDESNNQQQGQQASAMHTGQPTVQSLSRIKNGITSGYQKVSGQNGSVKNAVKAVSSTLLNAVVSTNPRTQNNRVQRRMSEPLELTEENFYNYLQNFVLSDGQRWENKYPRRHTEDHSLAEIKDYQPQETNPLKRLCCRCGKEYYMNKKGKYVTREECVFHWGRLRKRRERGAWYPYYSCCDGNGDPCSLAILHVCERIGPLNGFVSTETWSNESASRKVFSLDCEMCYTTQGLELTRVTVVGFDLSQTVDLFVKPDNPIVDYNTRFSGVTKEHLKNVDTTLGDIHEIFSNLFDKNTILMGHSLESDLKALKLIHHKVVDTALAFPHRLGLPFKRALRTLMGEYLQKIIQDGEGGHDSCEDARACLELMRYKFNEDSKKLSRSHTTTQTHSSSTFYSSKT